MIPVKEHAHTLCFPLLVAPRSSKNMVVGAHDNALKIKITAPPVEGRANEMCVAFLSRILGIPKTSISITAGAASKRKEVCLALPPDAAGKQEASRIKALLAGY
ncbi:MAG: DUF167 domain-containing protein [Thermodesulfobacteriota bacterium]|nr:DUF167 domain-containing protein [Thermodesulfobacteriota bacterium]